MASENSKPAAEAKGKSKKSMIIVIALVLIVLGAGSFGGVYLFMQNNTGDKAKEIVETKVQVCQDLTVNLSDSGKYLKTTVYLSYDEDNSDLGDEITNKQVEIQDKVTYFLQSQKSEDFESNKVEDLKRDLIKEINSVLTKGKIVNVYFPNGLLVQ